MVGYYVATCKTSQSCLSQTELYSWIPKHMRRRPNLLHFSTMKLKGYASCWGSLWFLSTIRHRRPTIWRQRTNADSLVIKCLWLCWLVHTSSKWWSNSLYLNPEMFRKSFCSRRLLSFLGPCWTNELDLWLSLSPCFKVLKFLPSLKQYHHPAENRWPECAIINVLNVVHLKVIVFFGKVLASLQCSVHVRKQFHPFGISTDSTYLLG